MDLSVIIPVYNVEKYILECLESIYANDTLDNFEVLCIDDCGNDRSIDIIKQYIVDKNLKNLTIIKNKNNSGLSASRNTGIKKAKGKYICFLDSDDMIDNKSLKAILQKSIKNNLDIADGNYKEIFETSKKISVNDDQNYAFKENVIYSGDVFFDLLMKSCYTPMVWRRIYKRDFLIKNKLFFVNKLKFEDEEFFPRAVITAKKVAHYGNELYLYRRRDDSITTTMTKNNDWVNHYLIIINNLTTFANNNKNRISYYELKNRISEIVLSLYKNPIVYGSSKENIKEIVQIVKRQKIYKIPIHSYKLSIKLQGILMRFPKLFFALYRVINRGVSNESS